MDKRESIIKALEFCLMPTTEEELMSDVCSHDDCPYYRAYSGGKCVNAVCSDALVLLKEDERAIQFQSDRLDALLKAQEPVAPVQQPDEEYICGACGNGVVGCDVFDEAGIESVKNDYCPTCGRRVKWERQNRRNGRMLSMGLVTA